MGKVNTRVRNSRVSIQGKDIILDYEFALHAYMDDKEECIVKGLVPVEMYPYGGDHDILVEFLPVDDRFGVIDLEALYAWALKVIAEESQEEDFDWNEE
jgi:hypothetical protein